MEIWVLERNWSNLKKQKEKDKDVPIDVLKNVTVKVSLYNVKLEV